MIFLLNEILFLVLSGVFADSESDEEDERPKFSGRKRQKDYFAPVNFVSGGIKIGDKVTKEEADDVITVSDAKDNALIILLLSVIVVNECILFYVVHLGICCCLLLFVFVCCYLLLSVVICCYWLLSVVVILIS